MHAENIDVTSEAVLVPPRHCVALRCAIDLGYRHLGLSQTEFAACFGISPGTLHDSEPGRRVPEGPARVLLRVIERDPEAVRRALG